jgi:hypothetical protein
LLPKASPTGVVPVDVLVSLVAKDGVCGLSLSLDEQALPNRKRQQVRSAWGVRFTAAGNRNRRFDATSGAPSGAQRFA